MFYESPAQFLQLVGLFAAPDTVHLVTGLPRTASGELVRSILTKLALGEKEDFGDTSMVADNTIVAKLIKQVKTKPVLLKGSPSPKKAHRRKKIKKQKNKTGRASSREKGWQKV